jgi:hypothetical protein
MERRPSGRQSNRTEFQYHICYPPKMMGRCTCRMASAKTRSLRKLKVSHRSNLVSHADFQVRGGYIFRQGRRSFACCVHTIPPKISGSTSSNGVLSFTPDSATYGKPAPPNLPPVVVGTYLLMLLLSRRSSPKTSSLSRARTSPTVIE